MDELWRVWLEVGRQVDVGVKRVPLVGRDGAGVAWCVSLSRPVDTGVDSGSCGTVSPRERQETVRGR